MRAVYHKGGYPDLDIDWGDPTNIDLTDYTVTVTAFPFGSAIAFHKNVGLFVQPLVGGQVPSPNLVVAWSTLLGEDLDGLVPGTYVLKFSATHATKPPLEMYGELVMRENAPNFGYCEVVDLLLGDLQLSASINKYTYINSTADEMDAEIGQSYILPLDLSTAPTWVQSKLRDLNSKLATGRLITAQAMSGGVLDHDLQAYGAAMIKRALVQLDEIATGGLKLTGLAVDPKSFRVTAPAIKNYDQQSAVDQMSTLVMRGQPRIRQTRPVWQPGAAATTDPV